ncbi:hypothetical protein B0H65DRAFT_553053 [Neurospora tetraspora]|uniref:Uncharacterized protein n=1 Tax=Neurospora tetraspora TaxID=94610 RepID=A0AAE0J8N8_9PEZI|nr:hypothetical protein B0H65DRAFT_553053 [Neurospora tetraspora]
MKLQFTAKASSILGLLLTRSAQASFYVCTQENFVGLCQEYSLPYNDCHDFESGFFRKVVSAGPDPKSGSCTGAELSLRYPGMLNLGDWNNKAASFNCAAQ